MSTNRFNYRAFPELDQFFNETFRFGSGRLPISFEGRQGPCMFKPRMDLHEDAENNVVTATFDLPGLTKDKVHIDLQNGNLTISGEVVESAEKTSQVYAIRERESGQFSRSVKLPEGTKFQDVKARMEDGVLKVTFPKAPDGQEFQRIPIH